MKSVYYWILIILTGLVPSVQAQTITSLTPNSGTIGQTVDVLIRGVNTHFQQNVTTANFGSGIVVQNLRIPNPLTITATIQITSNAVAGLKDVTVVSGSEVVTAFSSFEVFASSGSFNANIVLIPVETISLSNIDLTNPPNTPILFFVNINNDNVKRYITVYVRLSSDTRGFIGTMITSKRILEANTYMRITNRDFSDVDINGPSGNEFLNIARNIGTYPPDNYTYELEITDDNGNVIAKDKGVNVVTNVNYNPELIWPGADFPLPFEEVSLPFPVFQWFGQMDKYDFYLFELLDGQTPQEAIRNIAVYQQKNIQATSLVYPAFAEKLIDGKKYAWYVTGKVSTAKGEQSLPSQPFRFIYKSLAGTNKPIVSKIEITPEETNVKSRQKLQLIATFFDDKGAIITNVTPEWKITPNNKGYITQSGLFTAGDSIGTIAVVVKAGGATEYAIVTITPNIKDIKMLMTDDMLRKLFGIPNEKETSCDGKGICMLTSVAGAGQGTISVGFELLPTIDGSRDFVMTFNINDLTISDPTQANYFVDAAGQPRADYNMDYTLTERDLCASLGVEPGELVITVRDHNVIEKINDTHIRVTYRLAVN